MLLWLVWRHKIPLCVVHFGGVVFCLNFGPFFFFLQLFPCQVFFIIDLFIYLNTPQTQYTLIQECMYVLYDHGKINVSMLNNYYFEEIFPCWKWIYSGIYSERFSIFLHKIILLWQKNFWVFWTISTFLKII